MFTSGAATQSRSKSATTPSRSYENSALVRDPRGVCLGGWTQGFELAETQIPKHGLMVPRSDHILDPDVHVGSLASDARCAVVLDLVPKERFEG